MIDSGGGRGLVGVDEGTCGVAGVAGTSGVDVAKPSLDFSAEKDLLKKPEGEAIGREGVADCLVWFEADWRGEDCTATLLDGEDSLSS